MKSERTIKWSRKWSKHCIRSDSFHDQTCPSSRKFNIGGKKFNVQSKLGSLRIEGNFRSREFKIKKGHELVATISKKFFAIGDKYGVKVEQRYQENAPFFLCLAIVVDEVAHD